MVPHVVKHRPPMSYEDLEKYRTLRPGRPAGGSTGVTGVIGRGRRARLARVTPVTPVTRAWLTGGGNLIEIATRWAKISADHF